MAVFNIIEPLARPDEQMREDVIVKKVAKKDISREEEDTETRKFVPVWMDGGDR